MTPVIVLSDAYLANAISDWEMPKIDDLPPFEQRTAGNGVDPITAFTPRSGDAGAQLGGAGHARPRSTGSAGWRRTPSPATSPTIPTITKRWCGCAPRRSRASPTATKRALITRATRRASFWSIAWGSTYRAGPPGRAQSAATRATRRRICICGSSGRFPPGSKTILRRYKTHRLRRDELRASSPNILRSTYPRCRCEPVTQINGRPFLVSTLEAEFSARLDKGTR